MQEQHACTKQLTTQLMSFRGPGGSMSQVIGSNNSYKPITNTAWVCPRLCKLQKGCTRLAAASDKVYQLLAQGRWFSPGTPASSTTKTDRHDIAEILLKVALKHQKSNSINLFFHIRYTIYIYRMKTYIYNLLCTTRFWNNLHQVTSKSKDWKAK